jgi:uncharacterized short protein YbdD (DUF466 family)
MQDRACPEPSEGRTGGRAVGWSDTWRLLASGIRRLCGMPDYAGHCEHLRRCHPGTAVPTEAEFFEQYLQGRYSNGPTRCC